MRGINRSIILFVIFVFSLNILNAQATSIDLSNVESLEKKLEKFDESKLPKKPNRDDYLSYLNKLEIQIGLLEKIKKEYIDLENTILSSSETEKSIQNQLEKPKDNIVLKRKGSNYKNLQASILNAVLKDKLIEASSNSKVKDQAIRSLYLKQITQADEINSFEPQPKIVEESNTDLDSLHSLTIKRIGELDDKLTFSKSEMSSIFTLLKSNATLAKSNKNTRKTVSPISENNAFNSVVTNVQSILRLPEINNFIYKPDFSVDNKLLNDRRGFIPSPLLNGKRVLRHEEKVNGRSHDGVVIVSQTADVQNVSQGIVLKVGTSSDKKYVVIKHDGKYTSVYANLKEVYVSENQKVKFGQNLGAAKNYSNNQHALHFQLWNGSQSLNPSRWLKNN